MQDIVRKEPIEIESERLREMGLDVGSVPTRLQLFRGKGCEKCRNTGYAGMTCILEMMPFTESMRKLTTANSLCGCDSNQGPRRGDANLAGKCNRKTTPRHDNH